MSRNIEIGEIFGKLTVIDNKLRRKRDNDGNCRLKIKCKCSCGTLYFVRPSDLLRPNGRRVVSCGHRMNRLQLALNTRLSYIEASARFRKISWKLSRELAVKLLQSPCFYCGSMGTTTKAGRYGNIKCNGIDRIDSNIGYTITNSVSCCYTCNIAKNDLPIERFLNNIKRIYEYLQLNNNLSLIQ